MTPWKAVRRTAFGLGYLVALTLGCGWAYNDSSVLVLTQVNVPTGGGSAEVMFQGLAGQQIQISLTGHLTTMQPYGNLIGPDGAETAAPAVSGVSNGFNTTTVSIPAAGTYRLAVFDGTGTGGAVTVRIELAAGSG